MAARCYPEAPDFESHAERTVWTSFRDQLPHAAALWSNVGLVNRKGVIEADLVILWPDVGVAVIEVKGGTISRADDGSWTQTSNDGYTKSIRPTDQARQCRFALRDFLRDHTSQQDIRITHMVAFPYTDVHSDFATTDCPRWMVLDRNDVESFAADRVEGALREVDGPPAPASEHVDAMVAAMTQRPGPQRDLVGQIAERADAVDLLTEKQVRILGVLDNHPRLLVRGGAGTGKSYLAVEQVRRLVRQGKRVAFVCYSHGLASFVQRRFEALPEEERPAYIGTFHHLGVGWGAKPVTDLGQEYWEEQLPDEMQKLAAHLTDGQRFDAFVIDEAQDFADAWWPAITAGLQDHESGVVTAFADEGQRVFGRQGQLPQPHIELELDENLRNTKQIAQTFGSLANRQMKYRGIHGDPVQFIPCPAERAIETADEAIVALMDAGWPAESVALLTTGSRHPIHTERQEYYGKAGYWDSFWETDDAFYGHVLGFKGLERPAVVLAVNGFRDEERAKELLYVGMSRARDLLVVCGDPEDIRRFAGAGVMKRLGI